MSSNHTLRQVLVRTLLAAVLLLAPASLAHAARPNVTLSIEHIVVEVGVLQSLRDSDVVGIPLHP